jgi:hypothetical protein
MASDGNSSTSIVAIFAIVLMVLIGGLIAYKAGVFGGGGGGDTHHKLDVNVK